MRRDILKLQNSRDLSPMIEGLKDGKVKSPK